MDKIRIIRQLGEYTVFNINIVERIINKRREYARLVLHRLKKEGLILQVEKNKYTVYKDPLIVASNMVWPCYASLWSALRFYNLTEQLPEKIFIITTRARKNRNVKFMDNEFIFIKVRQKHFFGYRKEAYNNFFIFVAEPEKAVIDSVLLKKISISEIFDVIKEHKNELDINKIVKYIIKIKNKAVLKRFGYIFDKLNIKIDYDIKKFIDNKYVILDYAGEKRGEKNKKWMVIENVILK